jgi:hypothetical protein
LTYPVSNRHSRTGPSPCATAAPSAAPGGRQHCHAAQDAARAPAPTRLEVRNSLVRVHPYRSQRRRPGPNTAARAVSPLQIGSLPPGGQPEGRMAVRTWAGHPSRTGVEVSAPHGHGALLPRQHLRCAGVRGAERTSKEHRSDQPRANQETRVEEPVASLRSVPIRAIGPIDPFPLPMLCRRPYRRGSRSRSLAAGKR